MIQVETFTDPKIYNRVPSLQAAVKDYLKAQAIEISEDRLVDWNTLEYRTETIKKSERKCEDRLKVILTVRLQDEYII